MTNIKQISRESSGDETLNCIQPASGGRGGGSGEGSGDAVKERSGRMEGQRRKH